ncbi:MULTISPECIES: succinyl-diaminopimelate desuccinylase [Sphingobium]|jgi:succinyl-diaminopimelate desuccinylase|uniref:succinyl-diaminopimelate desuccinylase n=1 Tax=Sphingobium TaxID=165695 RepID=UPI000C5F1DE7|nr:MULTISPECIES: succinyl-diaminopimelate desuccinylase [Sphingobium]MBS48074.1 succinyl-diaminopimelate desuccinylase [Sphingobium sp.]MCC4255451.1 succinyl-diaminopimelate desuccinylase [Sphingobium lactosutens]HCW60393.1 succinyl-diaminopimelate desuccinylase [Sphingobium sp.]|tara:strand:- start:2268 stop:3413 length:1146 start_codon:yes stop_codon:yes gene_type:complete
MSMTSTNDDVVALAQRLLACPSVSPATGAVFAELEAMLAPLGFTVDRFIVGEAPDGPVENLLAWRTTGAGPHFAFAGHLDVVPPGAGWSSDPFAPDIRGDLLYGRGAVDMKGAIAAFVAALADLPDDLPGTISLIITGDEEGPAIFGTLALMERMATRGLRPDLCLVGEPTSSQRLGDVMKIGRRGSVNMWISVAGSQGHVAYPHLADNPIPRLVRILTAVEAEILDEGTEWFQPSNIEITDIEVGNAAHNVIPGKATARISIRFNDQHSGASLIDRITRLAAQEGGTVDARISGESFLTAPGVLSDIVGAAIRDVTGVDAELSTTGGTSDARFLSRLCPVVEFGLNNATMHKLDEAVALQDLRDLQSIYAHIVERALRLS